MPERWITELQRLGTLEPGPDLWDRAREGPSRPTGRPPGRGLTLVVILVVLSLAGFGLWRAFGPLAGTGSVRPGATCDPTTNPVQVPATGGEGGLSGLSVVTPTDAWAVGPYAPSLSGSRTVALHWDGAAWERVPTPNPNVDAIDANELVAVSAVASHDVWAVGDSTDARSSAGDGTVTVLIEHWDGSAWSIVPGQNPGSPENRLLGVAAIAPTDVWAVGFSGQGNIAVPLIEHWDGTTWSLVQSPEVTGGGSGAVLNAVTAVGPDDVWALGDARGEAIIEHWDGTAWTVVTAPGPKSDYTELRTVLAFGPGDVWAVGSALGHDSIPGTATPDPLSTDGGTVSRSPVAPFALHWDGSTWTEVPTPARTGREAIPMTGLGGTPDDLWAVGSRYLVDEGRQVPFAMHWDGSAWADVSMTSQDGGTAQELRAAASSNGAVWLAGAATDGVVADQGPSEPLIMRGTCGRSRT